MFERFAASSRQAIVSAQAEACELRHNYIGTEHLLLGLLRGDEGLGPRVLEGFGVTLEAARLRVAQIVGPGDEVVTGHIPFTPRAKRVLELALREGLALGEDEIRSEHLLLGLARENGGVAKRVLAEFGVSAELIHDAVIAELTGGAPDYHVTQHLEAAGSGELVTYGPGDWPFNQPTRPLLILAIVLAAVGFPLGLLVGFLVWG